MKLPPLALVAPSLCPRCDTPATVPDYCIACSLQLRQCGACLGIAGPFDRYCGFCGNELILGRQRPLLRWLWLVAALIPLVAGLVYGLSPQRLPLGALAGLAAQALPQAAPAERTSGALAVRYSSPASWWWQDQSAPQPVAATAQRQADGGAALSTGGDLSGQRPRGPVIALTRPSVSGPDPESTSPLAVLNVELSALTTSQQTSGIRTEVVQAPASATVGGRPAARVVLRLTGSDGAYYLERVYVDIPGQGLPPLVRLEAVAPEASWTGGGADQVAAVAATLRAR